MKLSEIQKTHQEVNDVLKKVYKDNCGLSRVTKVIRVDLDNGEYFGLLAVKEKSGGIVEVKAIPYNHNVQFYRILPQYIEELKHIYNVIVFEYKQWNSKSKETLELNKTLVDCGILFESVLKDYKGNKRTCRHHWSRK